VNDTVDSSRNKGMKDILQAEKLDYINYLKKFFLGARKKIS